VVKVVIPGAFIQADMDEGIFIELESTLIDLSLKLDKKYTALIYVTDTTKGTPCPICATQSGTVVVQEAFHHSTKIGIPNQSMQIMCDQQISQAVTIQSLVPCAQHENITS
jgi:hypothetical protein